MATGAAEAREASPWHLRPWLLAAFLSGVRAPTAGSRPEKLGGQADDGPAQPPVCRVVIVGRVPEHGNVEVGQGHRHRARRQPEALGEDPSRRLRARSRAGAPPSAGTAPPRSVAWSPRWRGAGSAAPARRRPRRARPRAASRARAGRRRSFQADRRRERQPRRVVQAQVVAAVEAPSLVADLALGKHADAEVQPVPVELLEDVEAVDRADPDTNPWAPRPPGAPAAAARGRSRCCRACRAGSSAPPWSPSTRFWPREASPAPRSASVSANPR